MDTTRVDSRIALAGLCAVAFCGAGALVPDLRAAPSGPLLPDLVPDPPGDLKYSVEASSSGRDHLLLRFESYVHNRGPGVLEIRAGDPLERDGYITMQDVRQRAYYADHPSGPYEDVSARSDRLRIRYEPEGEHRHFHVRDITEYALVDLNGRSRVPFAKSQIGFCLQDAERRGALLGSRFYGSELTDFCRQDDPAATAVTMGVSPGWRDVYTSDLKYQWIDASVVPPGNYSLIGEVDPRDALEEVDDANNATSPANGHSVTVPGYLARSGYLRATANAPNAFTMSATRYSSNLPGAEPPGPAEFRIDRPPQHGTLSRPTGQWLRGGEVVYVPSPAYEGRDSFTFSVRDEDHTSFPVVPSSGTATVQVSRLPSP